MEKKHSTVATYILAAVFHLALKQIERVYGIPIIEECLELQIIFLGLNEFLKGIS